MTDKKITARECRFATHIPSKHPDQPDVHLVKEIIHFDDGTTKPNIRLVKDFKRTFYVTKPAKRNHKQKKEYEFIENVTEYSCTDSDMRDVMAKALDRSWSRDRVKQLSNSPYVYGADITAASLIKNRYRQQYPNTTTGYSLAIIDIETDVVHGTEDILMVTITTKDYICTSVVKSFLSGHARPIEAIESSIKKYIPTYVEGKRLDLHLANTPAEAIQHVFAKAHELMPDWMVIWNIDFDMPKIISALEKEGIDPADVLSDPNIPKSLRFFKYKEGTKKKVTASGKVTPINPAAQWHVLTSAASFSFIDAMCVYKQLRLMNQEEPSYALDAILKKEIGITKLKFEEADAHTGLGWHQFMQTNYKVEYVVYNIFDCLSILELDDKTKDLSYTMPAFAGVTDFPNFKSQPSRIADAIYLYLLERGMVLSSGRVSYDEDMPSPLNLRDWINYYGPTIK